VNISSAIIYAVPRRADIVRALLTALPGVEIHAETKDGRFIVTVEDLPGIPAADTVMRLHQLENVLYAAMVCEHTDDETRNGEEPS